MTLAVAPISLLKYTLLLLFILPLQGAEKTNLEPIFSPPKGWHKNPIETPSSRVKVSFFTKAKQEFCPSINLLEEKVSSSIEEYLRKIQKIYESDSSNRFRRLGTLKTQAGIAYLTSLDMETTLGKVRVLQSIFLQEGIAYILTGAVLQEDFGLYQKELTDSFRSFSLESDLYNYIQNDQQKSALIHQIQNLLPTQKKDKKQWESFKRFVTQEFKEEGSYWQLLLLEETEKKLSKN